MTRVVRTTAGARAAQPFDSEAARGIVSRLRNLLDGRCADWGVTGLRAVAGGVEFLVCRADSKLFGPIAVRAPWGPSIPYETPLDSRRVLRQEYLLLHHLGGVGLPAPRAHALHLGEEGPDFLVTEYVEHDRSLPAPGRLGAFLRALHAGPPPDCRCIGDGDGPTRESVARRMARLLRRLRQMRLVELAEPGFDELAALLRWQGERRSLLHMDARPPDNVLTREGRIIAVIDWTSALTADPALEICRMDELGLVDGDFLAGYGDPDCLARVPRPVELIYRLDTAVMLAWLFSGLVPDRRRKRRQIRRVKELYRQLRSEMN